MRLRSSAAGLTAGFVLALGASAPAIAEQAEVPVPRAVIYPGEVIGEGHLIDRPFAAEAVMGASVFTGRNGLVGKVAKQTLLPNAPIALGAVREPFAVKQGQPTVVVFQSGSLVISGTALSLQPGSIGETISLRNSDSGTTIRGVIQGDGTVRVGLP
jgi:flagella basal body P-ring formation protein FlgA